MKVCKSIAEDKIVSSVGTVAGLSPYLHKNTRCLKKIVTFLRRPITGLLRYRGMQRKFVINRRTT
jgi:hypothetical protein